MEICLDQLQGIGSVQRIEHAVHVVQRVCPGVGVDKCPVDIVDVHGEEEEVVAEDVGLPCSHREVTGVQVAKRAEEV